MVRHTTTDDGDFEHEPGDVFPIDWRVIGHSHAAIIAYYHIRVDVFVHRFEDSGEWVILTDQDWLDSDDGDAADYAEYARDRIDGTRVDPEDPYGHTRIDRPTVTDGGFDGIDTIDTGDSTGDEYAVPVTRYTIDGTHTTTDAAVAAVASDNDRHVTARTTRHVVVPDETTDDSTDDDGAELITDGGTDRCRYCKTVNPDVYGHDRDCPKYSKPLRSDGGRDETRDTDPAATIAPNYADGGVWFALNDRRRLLLSTDDARRLADAADDFVDDSDDSTDAGGLADRLRSLADGIDDAAAVEANPEAFDDVDLPDPDE